MKKYRIAPEVKAQIINRMKNDGVSEVTIYGWIGAKTEGGPSVLEFAKLKKENEELLKLVGLMTLKLSEAQKKKS
jgi:hypothetical protein